MDQREEDPFQALGICNRLYNLIKKSLLTHAYKNVILGDPLYRNSIKMPHAKIDSENVRVAHSRVSEEKTSCKYGTQLCGDELPSVEDDNAVGKKTFTEVALSSVEAKPPKKSVSINERVEEITETKKKKIRRKKSNENLILTEEKEDEAKPLRSILKVGSYSGERSISFDNPAV